jgi:hypothetical protein
MARKARRAPKRPIDPLAEYSTWDIRIAKSIYYGVILASIITVLGIWLTIIGWLVETGKMAEVLSLGPGIMALIIIGIIAGHMFLLVLFYTLFRGGILKLCRRLFKDRIIAKKYEDYTTLRLLLAVTLIVVYMFVITLIIIILPSVIPSFWNFIADFWLYIFTHFNGGEWVLFVGVVMFIIILLIYIGFVIWNHGVYAVLKRVKRIEEEQEIDEVIKIEGLKDADEETIRDTYEKQTGKKALYRGKETNGYLAWKKKVLG